MESMLSLRACDAWILSLCKYVIKILELVVHAVPKYGHMRHACDLHKHMEVKRAYNYGNNSDDGFRSIEKPPLEEREHRLLKS